ncbi:hypothetical protein EDC53_102460 [Phytobacter diazotrophicus]|nr:hypothetical protein EDC53_102460 [Phytobacter diazotrophicus]
MLCLLQEFIAGLLYIFILYPLIMVFYILVLIFRIIYPCMTKRINKDNKK